MKELVEFTTLLVSSNDKAYSLEELNDIAQNWIIKYGQLKSFNIDPYPIITFRVRVEKDYDVDYCTANLSIVFYREETDQEEAVRLRIQETARLRLEAIDKKKADQKAAADKRKKELEADPDYSKFVELKKKFKS